MVWAIALIIAGGIADFDDGDRGIASWYRGYYSSGEQRTYVAVGSFRNFHDKPYLIVVTNRTNGRQALAWVRDHCGRCYSDGKGKRVIDLSPDLFYYLSEGHLGWGLLKVRIELYDRNNYLVPDGKGRQSWLLR